jgi:hypothetical protein
MARFPEIPLTFWALLLNAIWEFAQSPLYGDASRGLRYLLWTRLHCTVGDVLIVLVCFWITSLLFRNRFWVREKRRAPTVVFLALGVAYTVWSEWFHTQVAQSWEYAPAMPRLFGIGIAPILQWIAVPFLLVLALRRIVRPTERALRSAADTAAPDAPEPAAYDSDAS